jgi:ribosomal protein S27E
MTDDLRRSMRPVTKVIAACEACGHQAIVGLPQGARLRCSRCGGADVVLEPAGEPPRGRPMLMGFRR